MTLGSASSGGRVRDALSGRTKVAIVTGASSGIGSPVRCKTWNIRPFEPEDKQMSTSHQSPTEVFEVKRP